MQPTSDAGTDVPTLDVPATDAPTDASMTDVPGDDAPDAGVDAPLGDGGADDVGADGGVACAPGLRALRGVCIAECTGFAALEAALGAGVVPVAHACRAAGAFDVVGTNVYELEAIASSSGTTLRLVRWAFVDGDVTVNTVAQRVYAPSSGELVFPGFVAVNADESHAVFGYTTTLAGSLGGVIDVTTASMTFVETAAPGNFDAGFVLSHDYVVNGQGFDGDTGQALYLVDAEGVDASRLVVDGMGEYSGSIALWPEQDLVVFGGTSFGGWPDGSTGNLFFVLDLERLLGTPDPIDAFTVAQHFTLPSAFEMLTGGRIAALHYDGSFAVDGIVTHQLERTGAGPVSAGPEVFVATGGTFTNLGAIEDDVILVHAGGALRVRLP